MSVRTQVRRAVAERAGGRCEYCRLPQWVLPLPFHTEHVRAVQHGGDDRMGNLALACPSCNLHKGPNLTGIDRLTDRIEPLFDPRRASWQDHFRLTADGTIHGLTATGRTTVATLDINSADQILTRRLLIAADLWNSGSA